MKIIEQSYEWNGGLAARLSTTRIILHHAAAKTCTAQQIHQWHLGNGWTGIGYHFFVRKDGSVYRGRPENTVGAHAGNNNYDSIGVCFEGSFDKEQMGDVQRQAGVELVAYLKDKYGITKVQRHSDVNATGCPGDNFPFDAIAYGKAVEVVEPETAETVYTLELPMLSRGDKGPAARVLQALLIGYGYDCGGYGADGDFGAGTERGVEGYQKASGLVADGIVGSKTWAALVE